jgi:hypothetical protein
LPTPNWWRPLPRPIVIPDVMELATLADVRILVEKRLPKEYRSKFTWRQFAGLLKRRMWLRSRPRCGSCCSSRASRFNDERFVQGSSPTIRSTLVAAPRPSGVGLRNSQEHK